MYHEEPELKLNNFARHWQKFFPKEVERLGDNLFLVTWTQDAKGRSLTRYTGLVYWQEALKSPVPPDGTLDRLPGWNVVAIIRRNQTYHGKSVLRLEVTEWSRVSNIAEHGVSTTMYFKDDDEQFERAKRTMLAIWEAWHPDEFYPR